MQRFTLEVPDTEVSFFTKLIESLRFVRRVETPATKPARQTNEADDEDRPPTKEEILDGIRQGLLEIREAQKSGKKAGRDAREVLEELRRELA